MNAAGRSGIRSFSAGIGAVALAACSRAAAPSRSGQSAAVSTAECSWRWTAAETLLYHGASFAFGGPLRPPPVIPTGTTSTIVADRMSLYGDSMTAPTRLIGVSIDANGRGETIAKAPFMRDILGMDAWSAPGRPGTVHLVWTTLMLSPARVVYSSTDGTRWSNPDTILSVAPDALASDGVAAAGDDVVVALPVTETAFSGIVVATRLRGKWDVARFDVRHQGLWELAMAPAMDRSGTTVAYFRPTNPGTKPAPDSAPPGLYVRHRAWGGAWGPEIAVSDRPGFSPIPVETADGTFHVFWRGLFADSASLHHAATRDFKTWHFDQIDLPKDIQSIDAAAEGAGVRVVMMQTDDVNGLDQKYANLLTVGWRTAGFSALDTISGSHPAGIPAISRASNDTDVVSWGGARVATYTTMQKGKPFRYQSIVPVTVLSRHVRDCSR